MTNATVASANVVTRFQAETNKEYVRSGKFEKYTGTSPKSIFQVNRDLKKVSIPLIGKLTANGVRGNGTLSGSEEAVNNYAFTVQPTYIRHGVQVDNEENEKAEFDLFQEGKEQLMPWAMELKKNQFIQALGAIEAGGTYYNYGGVEASGAKGSSAASAANMDTWNTNNGDRILYGAAVSNRTAGDHTTSLGTIDTTNDKLTPDMVSLLKRRAALARPLISPIMLKSDEPWYVFFVGSLAFRDLRENSTMAQANREAMARGSDNPLFTGGDLMWDSVIIKEIPEIDTFIDGDSTGGLFDGVWGANATGDSLATSGASSSRVGIGFFCGAQAAMFGIGRAAEIVRKKEDDYGFQNGVGIQMKHDIKKIFYNNKQHGMVTSFHSASADA